jgi:hypothetical protein
MLGAIKNSTSVLMQIVVLFTVTKHAHHKTVAESKKTNIGSDDFAVSSRAALCDWKEFKTSMRDIRVSQD